MNRLAHLQQVVGKGRWRVIGLMSGTSMDGVDACLVEIEGAAETARVELLAFRSYPFPESLRERVFTLFDPDQARIEEICVLDFLLGELFAAATLALLAEEGVEPDSVDVVATAGQTVWHDPEPEMFDVGVSWIPGPFVTRSTLALGQPAVIAERTGILTVGDLRVRDVAAGGHGAPLVAYADWALLRHPERGRCIQNLGGIGNVTYLPPGAARDDVVAFDTGPGNMVIDALAAVATDDEWDCDRDGELARRGRVDEELLKRWLAHPYFDLAPPRTTGRETFGDRFVRRVRREGEERGLSAVDLVATATALTAHSIAEAYRRFVLPRGPLDEVVLGGGGARNPVLREQLQELLGPVPVRTHEEVGIDSRAKEAMAIALIAHDSLLGLPTNLQGATGGRPAILGTVCL